MPIYICAILLMIAADQAVKYWAFTSLQAQPDHSADQWCVS